MKKKILTNKRNIFVLLQNKILLCLKALVLSINILFQERELKRQQAMLLKEQVGLYIEIIFGLFVCVCFFRYLCKIYVKLI